MDYSQYFPAAGQVFADISAWIVSPQAQTVEVLRLSPEGTRTAGIYGVGMRVQSEILAGLELPIDDIFA